MRVGKIIPCQALLVCSFLCWITLVHAVTPELTRPKAKAVIEASAEFTSQQSGIKVREITGITDEPLYNGSIKQVQFTYEYPVKFGHMVGKAKVDLRLYDDGWRVEGTVNISQGEREQTAAERSAEQEENRKVAEERTPTRVIGQYVTSRYDGEVSPIWRISVTDTNVTDSESTLSGGEHPTGSVTVAYADFAGCNLSFDQVMNSWQLNVQSRSGNGFRAANHPHDSWNDQTRNKSYLDNICQTIQSSAAAWGQKYRSGSAGLTAPQQKQGQTKEIVGIPVEPAIAQPTSVKETLTVDDAKVAGITRNKNGFVAILVGRDGKARFMKTGDNLYDGQILEIQADKVIFRQDLSPPVDGLKSKEVVKKLYPD